MIKIAIVGHANSGKTTLVRTITKGTWGEVDDRAGVTTKIESVSFAPLRAQLLDTPGFQEASSILRILKNDITDFESLDESDFKDEKEALRALTTADACIYVVSLESVPDNSYDREITLVKLANSRVVGLLNKLPRNKEARSNRRIRDWEDRLRSLGIKDVFEFDAHWDRYSKLDDIYAAIAKLLSESNKEIFIKDVQSFNTLIRDTRDRTASKAAGTLLACRAISDSQDTATRGFDKNKTLAELKQSVAEQLTQYQINFAQEVLEAYRIAVSRTDASDPELKANFFNTPGLRLGEIAKHSAAGTAIGAAIGAGIGLFIAGPPGALLGAQIGGGSGATVGLGTGAVSEINQTVTVEVAEKDLKEISLLCLATTWCATHQGFGGSPTVAKDSYAESLKLVKQKVSPISHPEWKKCSEQRMVEWFSEKMEDLDT